MELEQAKLRLEHLENLRKDVREEVKKRIEQRDKYSIQLTIGLAATAGAGLSKPEYRSVLFVTPLVAIYFTALILYSYRIHGVLSSYLREVLEPEMKKLAQVDTPGWEEYYKQHQLPGIRGRFFLFAMGVLVILSCVYLLNAFYAGTDLQRAAVMAVVSIYFIGTLFIFVRFRDLMRPRR